MNPAVALYIVVCFDARGKVTRCNENVSAVNIRLKQRDVLRRTYNNRTHT